MQLRLVAADDEALALSRLTHAVAAQAEVDLVGTAMSGRETLEVVRLARPDVLLLDVQMASFGGFDVMRALSSEARPLVIFVTAYENFAVQAFDVAAVDYLLKPVDFDRLGVALERVREVLRRRAPDPAKPTAEPEPPEAVAAPTQELWAERRGVLSRVRAARIEWLQSERDYVRVHTDDGSYLMRGPLGAVTERLDAAEFVQVRRSAVVRAEAVVGLRQLAYDDCRIVLRSGHELRIGATYLGVARRLLGPG
ncbi:MAG: response regulator transcription factor [Pseudomonadota bacterium]